MEQIETLKRKIKNAKDIKSVVKTMKTLAAVNIRSYEKAVTSLKDYSYTMELGFRILFHNKKNLLLRKLKTDPISKKTLMIVFGSERGMSGQFNKKVADHCHKFIKKNNFDSDNLILMPVGDRIIYRLKDEYLKESKSFPIASSLKEIVPILQNMLVRLDEIENKENLEQIIVMFNTPKSGASFEATHAYLLPIDQNWLMKICSKRWGSVSLPFYRTNWETLYTTLVKEYFFVILYRAFVESLAAENASRLASMQAAENNIEERLSELNSRHNQQRQNAITSELLDIISGFEALQEVDKDE